MRLSDTDIQYQHQLAEFVRDVTVEPLSDEQIQPSSIDLTLSGEIQRLVGDEHIRIDEDTPSYETEYCDEYITVAPNDCVLATTNETIAVSADIDAEIKGRSSLGRLFLVPHTAGYVDAGYSGEITLEIVNHSTNTYELPVGMRVAQIVFNELSTTASNPYNERADSKYADQSGPTESRLVDEFTDSNV